MANAIEIRDVSKRFRILNEKYNSVKERLMHLGRLTYEDRWALQHINFEVEEGETVGLLGHNGSGKSTLLKCIVGILKPTSGEIAVRGRVAALLELGAGFHPDMSGRDNVYLNAALLGLSRQEVDHRFDEIVAFAELEASIDQQVKYYSSGMYVRLGFAVAVNVDPDILVVDEVLAVGDELFQRKCLNRVKQFQREGRTILYVTHGADQVRQICDRAAVLDQGELVALGPPAEAVRSYRDHLFRRQRFDDLKLLNDNDSELAAAAELATEHGTQPGVLVDADEVSSQEAKRNYRIRITDVTFDYPHKESRDYLISGEPLTVTVNYHATQPTEDVVVGISIYNEKGDVIFGANTDFLGFELPRLEGNGTIVFNIDSVSLGDGTYPVTIGMHSHDEDTVYDWHEARYHFSVMPPGRSVGQVHMNMTVSTNRATSRTAV